MKKIKRLLVLMLIVTCIVSSNSGIVTVHANSHGAGQGRTDTVNESDYHTSNWHRFSYNYEFTSGPDASTTFGVPTQTTQQGSNPLQDNVRRNKDVAFLPPSYGVFSGDIPTNPSSLFHSSDSVAQASNATFNGTASVNFYGNTTGVLQSTSVMQTPAVTGTTNNVSVNHVPNMPNNTTTTQNVTITQPAFYEDGSIGFLSIPAINTYVRVFDGETQANLRLGAARFEFTSAWDGNIGIAGHNRGPNDYFRGVRDLQIGDLIIYETLYGTRTYRVYLKEQISDTDFSHLGWSRNNEITLITCVIDRPSLRWVVKASEVR